MAMSRTTGAHRLGDRSEWQEKLPGREGVEPKARTNRASSLGDALSAPRAQARPLTGGHEAHRWDLSRELSPKGEAKAEVLLGHEGPQSGPECTRRDLNPHTLRYRNLNPARLPIPPLVRARWRRDSAVG